MNLGETREGEGGRPGSKEGGEGQEEREDRVSECVQMTVYVDKLTQHVETYSSSRGTPLW